MGKRMKPIGLTLTLTASLALTACLTQEERADIYGSRFTRETNPAAPSGQVKPAEPARVEAPVHKPAHPAPALRGDGSTPTNKPPVQVAPPVAQTDQCGASKLMYLRGKPLSTLNSMQFTQPLRIILPGQMVTQDFNPDRLNIMINAQNMIENLRCG